MTKIKNKRGNETNINSITLDDGEFAITTNPTTNVKKLYVGLGGVKILVASSDALGDMTKDIYDTDNDGIVDQAERVEWNGIVNKAVASDTTLGLFKVGSNLSMTSDGVLSGNSIPESFIPKSESFTITNSQTTFNLIKGYYTPGSLTWSLYGSNQPKNSITEISSTSFSIPSGLVDGTIFEVQYIQTVNLIPFPHHKIEHLPGGVDDLGLKLVATSGSYNDLTSKPTIPTTLPANGGNADTVDNLHASDFEGKQILNTVRGNLGNPTVEEMALFHGQFSNKLRFIVPFLQEESTDGITWTTSTRISVAQFKDIMRGEGETGGGAAIPSLAVGGKGYYRLTWDSSQTGYVSLNYLYIYNSTSGNNVTFKVEQRNANGNVWSTLNNGNIINWPGHTSLPHSNIPFSSSADGGHYNQVRVTFSQLNALNTNSFTLYGIEWFGGYPAGRRNVESYDGDKNVTFPSNITGTKLISTIGTGTAPLQVSSTTVVPNLNVSMLNGLGSSAFAMCSTVGHLTCTQLNNCTTLSSGLYSNTGDGILKNDGTVFKTGWWHVIHMHHSEGNGYDAQMAIPLSGEDNVYYRHASGGTWGSWKLQIDSSNLTKSQITDMPTKTSQFTNDSGFITSAGSGAKIAVATTAPTTPSPGDFWYKQL